MQAFVGDYWVVTFCRHSSTPLGAKTEWQARADVYRLNEKTPTHCILSQTGFASCEAAKLIALNKGVSWARGRAAIAADAPVDRGPELVPAQRTLPQTS